MQRTEKMLAIMGTV